MRAPGPATTRCRRAASSLLLVALPLLACGGGADPQPSGEFPPLASPSLPSVADGVSQRGVPQLINAVVAGGTVTSVGSTVDVGLNTRVRLTVLADTADVLLVRGYDLRAQLTVNQPVLLEFLAARPGDADVVLESSTAVLTTLRVS